MRGRRRGGVRRGREGGALRSGALLAAAVTGAAVPGAAAQDGSPVAGISRELAIHRAATLSDVRYEISLTVPPGRDHPVTGKVTIRFRKADDGPLVVDFADPSRVDEVLAAGGRVRYRAAATHLVVPAASVPPGPGEVTVRFTAADPPLNRRDDFLYTLFVPDRAHEAIPSFDQPDLRARFRLELTVPAGWEAVANGEEVSREGRDDGVVYRFAETEPIPTYLFAFAAGRFEVEEAVRDGRRLRLLHRETDRAKVERNLDALFDLHGDALAWLEEYTGIPYPFGKFDFVAIPSFQYNGMEHPGAILYRASSLFLDESATRSEELGRASVIAHETAHMWFGDLVTMEWFDDVWMKEVFANFMAAKIVNPSFPELDHDLRFLLAHYPAAYSVDRTPGANPIRQPLDNLADAGSLYGAIIYQKAPIVMRQLERLAGPAPFRQALRAYLSAHAFGNAGWPDLVEALDGVTELEVAAWSRAWIEEPGRPRIDVAAGEGGYTVRQEDPLGRDLRWDQVLDAGVLRGDSVAPVPAVRMAGASTRLPGVEGPLLPNAGGLAYGLFVLDGGTRAALLRSLPSVRPAVARAAGWVDLWELMLEGEVPPEAILDLALRMTATEDDELLAQAVLDGLTDLFWRFLPPVRRQVLARRVEKRLWERAVEPGSASKKAAFFNAWRSVALTPDAIDRMRAVWAGEEEVEGLPLSEQDRTTLALHLAVRDVPDAAEILDRQGEAIANPDRKERFAFIRSAAAGDPATRDSFFAALAEPGNRAREEWVVTALSYLHHPLRAAASLRYVQPALELLPEIQATGDIFFPGRWLAGTLSGHSSEAAAEVVRSYLREAELSPRLRGKLLQEADPLFRAVRLR